MNIKNPIPFNKPFMTGLELEYIKKAYSNGRLAGNGEFTKLCEQWFEKKFNSRTMLVHSCTAALEMAAILLDIKPGDEIILPSYTFVSSANAFVLRGGVPVFIDIREDTLNIDERLIEEAISPKTRAILVVHYAGVPCEMDVIVDISNNHKIYVIEDNAQGLMSKYKERYLGTLGDISTLSFHETKNIISGEGGAITLNNSKFIDNAEIIREKGTDRTKFSHGQVDKYTWQHIGSSYLPGEIVAGFLFAQLQNAMLITKKRISICNKYHQLLEEFEENEFIRRPIIPSNCSHNGHMYYILLNKKMKREKFISYLNKYNINTPFHYIPLHSSRAGLKYGKVKGKLKFTDQQSHYLVRLPLWIGLNEKQQEKICEVMGHFFKKTS